MEYKPGETQIPTQPAVSLPRKSAKIPKRMKGPPIPPLETLPLQRLP